MYNIFRYVMFCAWVQSCHCSENPGAALKVCTWINNAPLCSLGFVCGSNSRLFVSINDLFRVMAIGA